MANPRQKAIEAIANTEYDLNQTRLPRHQPAGPVRGVRLQRRSAKVPPAEARLQGAAEHHQEGRAAHRPGRRRRRRQRHEGLGPRTRRDALHPPVPADDRPDRREARLASSAPPAPAARYGRVQRQGTGEGRAGRQLVPERRHPRHVRGPRVHRLGPDQPRVHPRVPERRDAGDPDRVRVVDRRGARQEDAAAAERWRRCQHPGPAHPETVRQRRPRRRCSPPSARSRSTS